MLYILNSTAAAVVVSMYNLLVGKLSALLLCFMIAHSHDDDDVFVWAMLMLLPCVRVAK